MATLQLDFETDSEDGDYVPPAENNNSDSDSGSEGEETSSKRVKLDEPEAPIQSEEHKRQAREALWASFQAPSAAEPASQSAPSSTMVKIEKRYKFAGEEVVEVVEVSEDSADVQKWPRLSSPSSLPSFTPSLAPKKAAPKRRKGLALPDIPSQPKSTVKKLSTLDKSTMDWKSHVAVSGTKDELDASKKSGSGYLDKVEFLDRVSERKDALLEASKGTKRRRT